MGVGPPGAVDVQGVEVHGGSVIRAVGVAHEVEALDGIVGATGGDAGIDGAAVGLTVEGENRLNAVAIDIAAPLIEGAEARVALAALLALPLAVGLVVAHQVVAARGEVGDTGYCLVVAIVVHRRSDGVPHVGTQVLLHQHIDDDIFVFIQGKRVRILRAGKRSVAGREALHHIGMCAGIAQIEAHILLVGGIVDILELDARAVADHAEGGG